MDAVLKVLLDLLAQFGIGFDQFLNFAVGLLAIPLITWLKARYGLIDRAAAFLTAGVAVVLSLVALFLYGRVGLAEFTLGNFAAVFGVVYATARLVYEKIVQPKPVS